MVGKLNPMDNLTAVARQLALYFDLEPDPKEIQKIILTAQMTYRAPRQSLITGPFFWLFNLRNKITSLQKALDALSKLKNKKSTETTAWTIVSNIFKDGYWEETSKNTEVMRELVKALPDYDQSIVIPGRVIKRLKLLLCVAIHEREENKQKLNDLEDKLLRLDTLRLEKENEIKANEKYLQTLKQEASEKNLELKAIELLQLQKEAELKKIEQEKQEKEVVFNHIKGKFLSIHERIDISDLNQHEIEELEKMEIMTAKHYLADRKERLAKNNELALLRKNMHVKSSTYEVNHECKKNDEAEQRHQELLAIKNQRQVEREEGHLDQFKKELSISLAGRLPSLLKHSFHVSKQPEKNVTVIDDYERSHSQTKKHDVLIHAKRDRSIEFDENLRKVEELLSFKRRR